MEFPITLIHKKYRFFTLDILGANKLSISIFILYNCCHCSTNFINTYFREIPIIMNLIQEFKENSPFKKKPRGTMHCLLDNNLILNQTPVICTSKIQVTSSSSSLNRVSAMDRIQALVDKM